MHADERFEEIRATIRREMSEHNIASVAVAVSKGDEILWEEAFGWADREARVPATPHTMYSLASISKPVTTTGLMVLVERGLIDLDRPINDYLGDAKLTARVGDAADATVRRVANHSSGLPLHFQFFYEDEPYHRPPMDETIRRYANLMTAPGERPRYSNLGYGILDYVIERVSGKPYVDFMREEVFLPLGMTRSSIDIGPGLERYAAQRYAEDGLRLPFYDFDHPGGSAVYCSAHDLLRFGMFQVKARQPDQKPILADETIDAMQQPTSRWPHRGEAGYGVGWGSEPGFGEHTLVSHGGSMGGVRTSLVMIPTEQLVAVVLTNSSHESETVPFLLFADIFALLLPDMETQLEGFRAARQAVNAHRTPAFEMRQELVGEWRGAVHTYERDLPFTLWFTESGDIHAQLGGGMRMLVNNATYDDGWLAGKFPGDIGTPDASRRLHDLYLDLCCRGDLINGSCIAFTTHNEGSAPDRRVGNALSYWAEVRRS